MTTRLRELAERWKSGDFEERECAEQLLAILDAEGDGAPARPDGVSDADVRDAARYRWLRDADPDSGSPYIARQRQDSWGNWKDEWLGLLEADRAIDAARKGERHE